MDDMVKARYSVRCGRCREFITPGSALSREYGVPWHTACVITYKRLRRELALAASAAKR